MEDGCDAGGVDRVADLLIEITSAVGRSDRNDSVEARDK